MNKLFTLCFSLAAFVAAVFPVNAQTPYTGPTTQPFGKVDKADLEMTSCDFEKDASAEVLFDKGDVYFTPQNEMVFERHVRIKIFNDKGKNQGSIRMEYFGGDRSEFLTSVQAETINMENGVMQITKVDKKQMFTQPVDKIVTAFSFAFPNVKAGSIIEYKYALTSPYLNFFPDWYFQSDIPTRYSEFSSDIPNGLFYKNLTMVSMPYVKNTENLKALANVPSLDDEPYMSSWRDNAQRILYELQGINMPGDIRTFSDTWEKVGKDESGYDDFGGQIRRKLSGEEAIIEKSKSLTSQASKIAYIFGEVKDHMKWNDRDVRYTDDGTSEAWDKKTGNSTEINLALCHLLQKSGIKAVPMLVSTKKHGKVNPAYAVKYQFNKTVAYIPIDSANYYVLDATNKFNVYNDIPQDLLNNFGLYVDKDNGKYDLVFLQKTNPARQMVLVSAEIKPDGKISGTAQINSFSYNRIAAVAKYKTDGEEKYKDYLRDNDENLKISNVKFDNMDVDTLPLTQNIDFNLTLSGSDENYIYLNPNLFTGLHTNLFLSENRFTNIDFGYMSSYSINGIYKIPAGYKVDALPRNASMSMSDKSINFRRIVAEQDGSIVVRYVIDYKKSLYFKESYPEFYAFFKKMHEMLNEQIVLKKS
jgi:hypothetical protein